MNVESLRKSAAFVAVMFAIMLTAAALIAGLAMMLRPH